MESMDDKILRRVRRAAKGTLFFTEDFLQYGTAKTISKALERLVNRKILNRVTRGIYALPEIDPVLGSVKPGTEAIAEAIRRRDRARIIPTGVAALNALGLSTQVPMNVVYLTDGAARKLTIGRRKIIFKKTAPRNLAATGKISGQVIQAMKTIGKDKISESEIRLILQLLKTEKQSCLEHDIKLAPEWIRIIMRGAVKK